MNLSKDSIRLLRWMNQHDDWKYVEEIEKGHKKFNHRSFQALQSSKLIDHCVFEDEIPEMNEYGEFYYPKHYRISDAGKAYLEGRVFTWLPELRGWVAIVISIFALLVSIISLILR